MTPPSCRHGSGHGDGLRPLLNPTAPAGAVSPPKRHTAGVSLFSVSDVAAILRLKTPRAVRQLIRDQIGYVMVGQRMRVKPADLEAYLERQHVSSIRARARTLLRPISPRLPKKASPRRVK